MESQKKTFILEMDVLEEYYDMFMDVWPKALKKFNEVSENND